MANKNLKFLVIRRDNIGDLVCITPLLRALRERFPDARICALVNSYNLPVLANNPDVDEVYAYTKAKHRQQGQSVARIYFERLRLILNLRRQRFDYAILAAPGFQARSLKFARLTGPRHIIGFAESSKGSEKSIDIGLPYTVPHPPMHEVEDTFRLLAPLGITPPPPPLRVVADIAETAKAHMALGACTTPLIGIHISARKVSQRWPAESFANLIKQLHKIYDAKFMLFWSPGEENNPLHPGDDAKARLILNLVESLPVTAYPTYRLEQLIGGLSLCDLIICSDGGAMHLAAGLGKPIVCFFGKSDSTRWHPWGVPYILLQPESQEVSDITVSEVLTSIEKLPLKKS